MRCWAEPRRDEAGFAQHLEVLRDGGLTDRERVDELVHAARGSDELTQDLTPRRLGEHREDIHV
jgi:DNA-binding transcriptional ArsR family regulator